jgi:organic radical activating enzyme
MPYLLNGKIHGPYMEYNMTEHCNIRCKYCGQFAPYNPVKYADLDGFKKDLYALSKVYHVIRFRFVGGEPLLHKQLLDFVKAVRQSGIADRVVVCTNGKILDKMDDEFYRAIDELDISWYPVSGDDDTINLAKQKCEIFNIQFMRTDIGRFQLNRTDIKIEDEKLIQRIFNTCKIAHTYHCHTFYDGFYYKCSKPLFCKNYYDKIDIDTADFKEIDGIPIHGPDLLKRLVAHLQDSTPLKSCHYCLGSAGRYVPWRELTRREAKHPKVRDTDILELIDYRYMRNTHIKKKLFDFLRKNRWLHPFKSIYCYVFRLRDYYYHTIGIGKQI